MIRKKIIHEKWPSKLEDIARWLKEWPTSLRLANGLFETGMPLIKQNGLYLPFILYAAELYFLPPDKADSACLSFRRARHGMDFMGMCIITGNGHLFVDVARVMGAKAYRDSKANPSLEGAYKNFMDYLRAEYGNAPFKVRTHKYNAENKLVEYTDHDLLFGNKPETIKVIPSPEDSI